MMAIANRMVGNTVNKNKNWERVGELVKKCGTEEDKIAWTLCRGEAAEWHINYHGGIPDIIKKLKTKTKKTVKTKITIVAICFIVTIVNFYFIFK